jgi:hypothetical protein
VQYRDFPTEEPSATLRLLEGNVENFSRSRKQLAHSSTRTLNYCVNRLVIGVHFGYTFLVMLCREGSALNSVHPTVGEES